VSLARPAVLWLDAGEIFTPDMIAPA
jgi:hypothetical protein